MWRSYQIAHHYSHEEVGLEIGSRAGMPEAARLALLAEMDRLSGHAQIDRYEWSPPGQKDQSDPLGQRAIARAHFTVFGDG